MTIDLSGDGLIVGVLDVHGQLLLDSVDENGRDVVGTVGDFCELGRDFHGIAGVLEVTVHVEALQGFLLEYPLPPYGWKSSDVIFSSR